MSIRLVRWVLWNYDLQEDLGNVHVHLQLHPNVYLESGTSCFMSWPENKPNWCHGSRHSQDPTLAVHLAFRWHYRRLACITCSAWTMHSYLPQGFLLVFLLSAFPRFRAFKAAEHRLPPSYDCLLSMRHQSSSLISSASSQFCREQLRFSSCKVRWWQLPL